MNGEVGGCGGGDVVVAIVVAALVACGVAACVCVCVRPNNANNVCCHGNAKGLHTRWR